MFQVDFDEVSNFPFTTSENCARHECESAVKSENAADKDERVASGWITNKRGWNSIIEKVGVNVEGKRNKEKLSI